ncbi:MAG: YtxH domain-containing protein [Acidobacteria bacterium]|nr:YtxH domain-containing protein [Acidobacteriota bacterium]MBI3264382.1 YtxH domain-containing protein [Acidobacteriota bacterium]
MPHEYESEGNGGTGFVMGLLTGTVLGAGLGMLFAPRSGSELRHQIADTAGQWKHTAGDQYRRAAEAAGTIADKGREVYDRARSAVNRGAEEARRYVSEAERGAEPAQPSERFSSGGSRL